MKRILNKNKNIKIIYLITNMQKVYTITGKTDGFGAQYHAIMSGIAICKYKNYEYLHKPMKEVAHVKTADELNLNKFIGIKSEKNNNPINIKECSQNLPLLAGNLKALQSTTGYSSSSAKCFS